MCEHCGKDVSPESTVCPHCHRDIEPIIPEGTGVGLGVEKESMDTDVVAEKKPSRANSGLSRFAGLGGFLVVYTIGRYLGMGFYLIVLLLVLALLVGHWFSKWYLRRKRINLTFVKWIVWSNVFTWLVPVLGAMTATAGLGFCNYFPDDSKKYKTIAIIGIVASFLTAIGSILIQYVNYNAGPR